MTASLNPSAPRAGGNLRAWLVLLTVVAFGLVTDLGTKWLAFEKIAGHPVAVERDRVLEVALLQGPEKIGGLLPAHSPVVVVPNLLDLSLVLNPGAVFGIGPGKRWFFIAFTVAAMVAGVALFAKGTRANQTAAHVAIGLLISGGLGNLYDRLTYGCVRDFLHPLPRVWPYVSNIADLWLIVGIGVLVIILWRTDGAGHSAKAPAEGAA